ncbi:sensor histidine kinase [Micromonospora sp. NBC_01813]|uniref:sensor histidine kinase n=1 Tax=Micromonospora sp. NBC_01813 TaxID=2975988 RepID=UPI002DDB8A1D|nr:histidine kinase [Micromonospora sp. NBC_01813]WSA08561.1 histidine kinase [Micromonospora sp. NBC_01813]
MPVLTSATPPRWLIRGRDLLFDLAIVGAVGLSALIAEGPYSYIGVGHGLAMAVALFARRRFPVTTYAVIALLGAAQLLAGRDFMLLPHDVAILIALYSVVKYARQTWIGFLALGTTLFGCAAAAVLLSEAVQWDDSSGVAIDRYIFLLSSSITIGVWLLGLTVRIRHLYVRSLEERAATAERERDHLARIAVVEERGRIARELHDIIAHSLSVMIVHADGGRFALDRDPERTRAALVTIGGTGREALGEMRQLIDVLRNPEGSEVLVERPRGSLDQVGEAVEKARAAGLAVEFQTTGTAPEVPDGVALAVYRIVQESLTNTLKHAGERARASVAIAYRPQDIAIEVVDDGGARVPAPALTNVTPLPVPTPVAPPALPAGGHGLIGMRERTALYGGEFSAGARLAGGWQVRARIPLTLAVAA